MCSSLPLSNFTVRDCFSTIPNLAFDYQGRTLSFVMINPIADLLASGQFHGPAAQPNNHNLHDVTMLIAVRARS